MLQIDKYIYSYGYVPNNVVREVFMTVALNQRDDPHG
jgi:hypothetical protein